MKNFFQKTRITGLLILGIITLFSCRENQNKNQNKQIFRYNEHGNINSLDPAFARDQRNIWPDNQLYNSLVQLDDSLNILPDLAKSWKISDDGKTYTFNLRNDVHYHKNPVFGKDSTRLMVADDVKFSLERLTDPNLASPGSWVVRDVKKIDVKNDTTVQIQLKDPFPAFLGLLSMTFSSIVPQEMDSLDFRESPIGTGPFKFQAWKSNEKLVFHKNKLYFEKDENGNSLPYLDGVAITFLTEKQGEFMQFILGNLDFLSGLDASYKDELLSATGELNEKYQGKINLNKAPYLNMEYIGINLESDSPEGQSKDLRLALNYGFDRRNMVVYLHNGIGVPAERGFIPKGLPGFAQREYYTYKPKKAKELIKSYREKHNSERPQISMATTAEYLDFSEFLQREWQEMGIKVDIDVMPPSTLLQQRSAGKLQTFRSSWIADYPDAQNYLSLFYSKNFAPNGPNYTFFKSPKFDSLYEKSLTMPELEDRLSLYLKMDSIVMVNAPVVPLFYDEVVRFTQKNIKGLGINPQNLLDLRRTKKLQNKSTKHLINQ